MTLEDDVKALKEKVSILENLYKVSPTDELPFSAELAFGKPIQKFKIRAKTLDALNEKVLRQIPWVKDNLKRELAGA